MRSCSSAPARRHGRSRRACLPRPYDLPLPLGYWLIGAGAAVALSFVAAAGLMRKPQQTRVRSFALPPGRTEALLTVLQGVSVAIFALLVAAGLLGDQGDWDRNILPVAVRSWCLSLAN